jgi:hypothetical protein
MVLSARDSRRVASQLGPVTHLQGLDAATVDGEEGEAEAVMAARADQLAQVG